MNALLHKLVFVQPPSPLLNSLAYTLGLRNSRNLLITVKSTMLLGMQAKRTKRRKTANSAAGSDARNQFQQFQNFYNSEKDAVSFRRLSAT